jgi:hypothetical protein
MEQGEAMKNVGSDIKTRWRLTTSDVPFPTEIGREKGMSRFQSWILLSSRG